jgi:histidine phosphotransfer protein HptB
MRLARCVQPSAIPMTLPPLEPAPVYSALSEDPDLAELVDLFVRDVPDRVAALEAALDTRNWDAVRVLAHQLKGAAGSYGFPELTRRARTLESAVREGAGELALREAMESLWAISLRLRGGAP